MFKLEMTYWDATAKRAGSMGNAAAIIPLLCLFFFPLAFEKTCILDTHRAPLFWYTFFQNTFIEKIVFFVAHKKN